MSRPPPDHGSDRYGYVELRRAPPGVVPSGVWWEELIAHPCADCLANVFASWLGEGFAGADPRRSQSWGISIAHDGTCPWLARQESHGLDL